MGPAEEAEAAHPSSRPGPPAERLGRDAEDGQHAPEEAGDRDPCVKPPLRREDGAGDAGKDDGGADEVAGGGALVQQQRGPQGDDEGVDVVQDVGRGHGQVDHGEHEAQVVEGGGQDRQEEDPKEVPKEVPPRRPQMPRGQEAKEQPQDGTSNGAAEEGDGDHGDALLSQKLVRRASGAPDQPRRRGQRDSQHNPVQVQNQSFRPSGEAENS